MSFNIVHINHRYAVMMYKIREDSMINLPCIRRPISKLNEASTVVPSSNSVNIVAATIIGAYIREEYLIILYYSASSWACTYR